MQPMASSRTCDSCKSRKVRCSNAEAQPADENCSNCVRRKEACHFGQSRRIRKPLGDQCSTLSHRNDSSHNRGGSLGLGAKKRIQPPVSVVHNYEVHVDTVPQQHVPLDIEHILKYRRLPGRQDDTNSLFKALDSYVKSSSIAVFSETRLQTLSKRLGHNKMYDLIDTMQTDIKARRIANKKSYVEASLARHSCLPLPALEADSYIKSYFEHVHPMFPFLNQKSFEEKVYNLQINSLQENFAWSALYHVVLALGSQFQNKKDFSPGHGLAWQLFKHALGLVPNLIGPDATLMNVQAITAMAIFSQNISTDTLENFLVPEAARLALYLNFNKPAGDANALEKAAVFWTIYCLDKSLSFNDALTSSLADFDIGCAIPEIPEAVLEGFDLFLSSVTLARIRSISYETLFSVKAAYRSAEQITVGIMQVYAGLERWRMSIPKLFRPGESIELHGVSTTNCRILLYQHYSYHSVLMAISRLAIHIGEPSVLSEDGIGRHGLIQSARLILELTRIMEPKVYTSIWIVAAMPLAAMFVLFESIVHEPATAESTTNLFFLDMAAGYFSRLEYESSGHLKSSVFSEFTFLAREFIHKEQNTRRRTGPDITIESASPTLSQSVPAVFNDEVSQAPSPDMSFEGPYRPDADGEYVNMDYTPAQVGQSSTGNDAIIIDFMDIFDPMLPNEDWHW